MDVHRLIAAINPEVFCQPKLRFEVKRLLRDGIAAGDRLVYLKAAAKAVPTEPNQMALERLADINAFKLPGHRSPVEQHTLILDRTDEPLEPLYFGLLHELQQTGGRVRKLVDTFTGTIAAGLSADLTRHVLQRQEQAVKVATRLHARMRSLLGRWQKWNEEKQALRMFEQARAPTAGERDRGTRILEKRWQSSAGLGTLSDKPSQDAEFQNWLSQSEGELRNRLEIERELLANELRLLKIEASWLKPSLHQLDERERGEDPALVRAFNTALFEVLLLVELPSEIEHAVQHGDLPKMLLGGEHRRPNPVLIVETRFRAVPERSASGSYVFRGRAEFMFTSYALNLQELALLRREVQRSEYGEIFSGLEEEASAAFHQLLADLDELLTANAAASTEAKPASEDTNPFSALFSIWEWFKTAEPAATSGFREPLTSDSDIEQVLRSWTLLEARQACLEFYEHEKQRLLLPCPGDL